MRIEFLVFALALVAGIAHAGLEKQDSPGPVTISVTPKEVGRASSVWEFEVVLDTHSQDLSDDLMKTAALAGEPPIEWLGSGPGGHHRTGVLRFKAIQPYPDVIELRIARPGEAAPRSFRWQLQ